MSTHAIGIDLGGSSIKTTVVTTEGQVLCCHTVDFDGARSMEWAERIRALISELEVEYGNAGAIGLSAPGLAAIDARSIAYMPGRLAGLEGLNWTDYLNRSRPVPVLNDAHAALAGEAWLGAASRLRNVVMLTLGTGVGGAAMVDGNILKGHLGRAGHLGHICLDQTGPPGITRIPGSLEYMIGNYSIGERTEGRFQTTHALIEAHLKGDAFATRVWLNSVRALGCGIASLINVLDPEVVILGGGISCSGEALLRPLAERLDEIEWRPGDQRVRIVVAELGAYAGATGAAWAGRSCE